MDNVKPDGLLSPVESPKPTERWSTPGLMGQEAYWAAYQSAASDLASLHATGTLWAIPIVFLYRHAIESAIKTVLLAADMNPAMILDKRGHKLHPQLIDLDKVSAACGSTPLSEETRTLLQKYDQEDPGGTVSRYAVDKQGRKTLLFASESFDLGSFVMQAESTLEELKELLDESDRDRYRTFLAELESA